MEPVSRNISEISLPDKLALEHVIGRSLHEKQRVIIQVTDIADLEEKSVSSGKSLPNWCDVYAGLGDDEIASLEKIIFQRADLTRIAE